MLPAIKQALNKEVPTETSVQVDTDSDTIYDEDFENRDDASSLDDDSKKNMLNILGANLKDAIKKKKHINKVTNNGLIKYDPSKKVMEFKFTPEKIMLLMSREKLKTLEGIWTEYEDGLDITQFTQLMVDHVHTRNDDEKYELAYGCYKLFTEVDINGDGFMEWGEFMQYIIDAVSGNTIKGGEGQETVADQIARIKAKKYNRFDIAKNRIDKSSHFNLIQQAITCDSSELILSIERFSQEIKFYDFNLQLQKREKVPLKKEGFVTGVAYDEKNMIYGVSSTDGYLHFYQKGKIRIEYLKSIETPGIQTRIFYMQKQQMWLTAGRDFKLRHWSIAKNGGLLQTLDYHTDEITACVEIVNPQCIATASLDKTIIMFDLEHMEMLRTIKEGHEKGIRHLRYQYINGAQMISIGNEIYANVWAPESLVSDIHIGRLNGHKKSIVDGCYLNKAPYFVTIDEVNVINFWDIHTLMCIQTISKPFEVQSEGLVVLTNNVFWSFGRRFIQLDTFSVDDDDDNGDNTIQILDNDFPTACYLNRYQLNIFVIRKQEVRMYDLEKGSLQSLQNNLFQEDVIKAEITKFRIDKRHRKAYIANNLGQIFVINCQNGVVMKNCTYYLEDQKNIQKYGSKPRESITSLGSSKYGSDSENDLNITEADATQKAKEKWKSKLAKLKGKEQLGEEDTYSDDFDEIVEAKLQNPEIVDMHLIWEDDLIMMVCANSREYMVYDESDSEESKLLRKISGGHKDEITIMAFDYHLSLIATGCINGEVTLYDFEMSKIEALLNGHTGDITAMKFLYPYPILVTASMDSTVCLWGVRGCPTKLRNVCLKRYQNLSWNGGDDQPAVVTRLMVWDGIQKGVKKYRRLKQKQLPATAYRNFEHNFVFSFKDLPDLYEDEFPIKKNQFEVLSEDQKLEQLLKGKLYHEILADNKSKTFVTQVQAIGPDYNDKIDEEKERIYLYIGDELGFLKLWDVTAIVEGTGIKKIQSLIETKTAYNPRRQEVIDCSHSAGQFRKSFQKQSADSLPQLIDPAMTGVLIREVKAHQDVVTSLSPVDLEDCKGLISSSKDMKVRTWSKGFDMWGNLNQKTDREDPKWKFPTRKKFIEQEKEIAQVELLIDKVDLKLKHRRKKLMVNNASLAEKEVVKQKSRANWFKMQEERKLKEQELQEKQIKMKKEQMLRMEKGELITKKIQGLISSQDVNFQMLKMEVPKKFDDGFSRDLQLELNTKQKEKTEELKNQLKDFDKQKLKKVEHEASPTSPLGSVLMGGPTTRKSIIPKRIRQVQMLNKIGKQSNLKSEISSLKRGSQRTIAASPATTRVRSPSSNISTSKVSGDSVDRDIEKSSPAFTVPKVHKRTITIDQMVEKSRQSPNLSHFKDSMVDRQKILELQKIPNIRRVIQSITKKDRFQSSSPSLDNAQSQKPLRRLLGVQEEGAQSSPGNLRLPPRDSVVAGSGRSRDVSQPFGPSGRPFSIADSEIQKVSDIGGGIYDDSKSSIGPSKNISNSYMQIAASRKRNQSLIQQHLAHFTTDDASKVNSAKKFSKAHLVSPFAHKKFMSIREDDNQDYSFASGSVSLKKMLKIGHERFKTLEKEIQASQERVIPEIRMGQVDVKSPFEASAAHAFSNMTSRQGGDSVLQDGNSLILSPRAQYLKKVNEMLSPSNSKIHSTMQPSMAELKPVLYTDRSESLLVSPGSGPLGSGSAVKNTHANVSSLANLNTNLSPSASKDALMSNNKLGRGGDNKQSFELLSAFGPSRSSSNVMFTDMIRQQPSHRVFMKHNTLKARSSRQNSNATLNTAKEQKKNNDFEFLKKKYFGSNSQLLQEQQELKQKLEEQRERVKQLNKQAKIRSML